MVAQIQVEHLHKIFGNMPREALARLRAGATKEAVLRETGQVVGLADITLAIPQGSIFVIMGLSGSGKSTLVRCLNRLVTPTTGHVFIDGEDIVEVTDARLREIRRTKISMVFQHFALFPHKTVLENVEFGLRIRNVPFDIRRQKARGVLALVGLSDWERHYTASLSGGMRQRVGLARAIATDAEILLMDEPFSALDPLIRNEMQEELLQLHRKVDKTVVFITHDFQEALKLGDRIAVMADGAVVQEGTPQDIVSNPATDYVKAFVRDVDRGRVFRASSVMVDPASAVLGRDSFEVARQRMEDLKRSALYVVDAQGRPVGVLTSAGCATIAAAQDGDLSDTLRVDFPRVLETATLVDLYGACETGLPVAVTDDSGRLKGVIEIAHILAKLAAPRLDTRPRLERVPR